MDMTEGIIDRFRTMAIARGAVLTGHVVGSLIQTIIGLAIVLGVALAIGYRPTAGPLAWVAAAGVLLLFALALVCLSAALGLAAKSVETASNTPMFLTLLPLLSSGFVPTSTMPGGLRQFAEYQPYTPVTQTVRGLSHRHPHRQPRDRCHLRGAWASQSSATSGPLRLYNRRRAADRSDRVVRPLPSPAERLTATRTGATARRGCRSSKRDTRFLLSAGNGSRKAIDLRCAELRSPSQMSIDNRRRRPLLSAFDDGDRTGVAQAKGMRTMAGADALKQTARLLYVLVAS